MKIPNTEKIGWAERVRQAPYESSPGLESPERNRAVPIVSRTDNNPGAATLCRAGHECDDAYRRQDEPEERHGGYDEKRGQAEKEEDAGEEEEDEAHPAGNVRSQACDVGNVGLLHERAASLGAPASCLGVKDDPGICHIQGAFAMCTGTQLYSRVLPQYALLIPEKDGRPGKNSRTGGG